MQRGSHPASPAMPSPAATAGSAPSGTSMVMESPTGTRAAIAPFLVRPNHRRTPRRGRPSPGGRRPRNRGRRGSSGWPVARMPRDTARSIGLTGAASTSTTSPDGSSTSATSGPAPISRITAAFIVSEPNRSDAADAGPGARRSRPAARRPRAPFCPVPNPHPPTGHRRYRRMWDGSVPGSCRFRDIRDVSRSSRRAAPWNACGRQLPPAPSARREPAQAGRGAYPPLKGRMSGFIPANTPSGFGYQSHTWRVTRSGCQKLNAAPLVGLVAAQDSWLAWNSNVPSL